jgi:hypothetical protein
MVTYKIDNKGRNFLFTPTSSGITWTEKGDKELARERMLYNDLTSKFFEFDATTVNEWTKGRFSAWATSHSMQPELRSGEFETFQLETSWGGLRPYFYCVGFDKLELEDINSIEKILEEPPKLCGVKYPGKVYLFLGILARTRFLFADVRFRTCWEQTEIFSIRVDFIENIRKCKLDGSPSILTQVFKIESIKKNKETEDRGSVCLCVSKFFASENKRHIFSFIIDPEKYEAYCNQLNFTDITNFSEAPIVNAISI